MTLPIFPNTAKWQNSQSFSTPRKVENAFGLGGIVNRSRYGINPIDDVWEVSIIVDNYAAIEAFLQARNGVEPFEFRYDDQTHAGYAYTCQEWSFSPLQGGEHWEFSAQFERAFRLVS